MSLKTKAVIELIIYTLLIIFTFIVYLTFIKYININATNTANELDFLQQYSITSLNCSVYGTIHPTENESCLVCTTITAAFQHINSGRWKNEENHSIDIDNSTLINKCQSSNK